MRPLLLLLPCLLTVAFSLVTWLEPWFQTWGGNRAGKGNLLAVALGDGRRLFANHVFVKADMYFHGGYYPSMFASRPAPEKAGLAAAGAAGQTHVCELAHVDQPKDWLDRFGRHFYPSTHRHLGEEHEEKETGDHDHDHAGLEAAPGTEREILPWLRLAVALDPEETQSYVLAAFWLRTRLDKVQEAMDFLREGLRANPGSPDILFELGRIYKEHHHDTVRARNLWELALTKWRQKEAGKPEPDRLLYRQLLANLAGLEEERQNYARAIDYLNVLNAAVSGQPHLKTWIDDLKLKQAAETGPRLPWDVLPRETAAPYRGPLR